MSNLTSNIWVTYKSYMKVGLLAMVISAILFSLFGLLLWVGNYQIPNNVARQIFRICSVILAFMATLKIIYIKTGYPKWLLKGELHRFTFLDFLNLLIAIMFLHSAFFSK